MKEEEGKAAYVRGVAEGTRKVGGRRGKAGQRRSRKLGGIEV